MIGDWSGTKEVKQCLEMAFAGEKVKAFKPQLHRDHAITALKYVCGLLAGNPEHTEKENGTTSSQMFSSSSQMLSQGDRVSQGDGSSSGWNQKNTQENEEDRRSQQKNSQERVCRFFSRGSCRRGKECEFAHPEKCGIFVKFGLRKFNRKGCEGGCEQFHPKACYASMKTGECFNKDCRFFHLNGTRRKPKQSSNTEMHPNP